MAVAREENLAGVLFRRLENGNILRWVISELAKSYYATAAGNIYRLRELEGLEADLVSGDLRVIAIKGAALIDHVYEDPGMRPMEDIDLLVPPGNLKEIGRQLSACGYRQDPSFPHMFDKTHISIDLHTHVLHSERFAGREDLLPFDVRRLLADSRPWRRGFSYLRRIDDVSHVMLLAHHAIKLSFSKRIWLLDMHEMMTRRPPEFWARPGEAVARYGQQRPMVYVLYMLKEMFGFTAPQFPWVMDRGIRLTRIERAVLEAKPRIGAAGDQGNLLWLCCEDAGAKRIRWFLRI